MRRLGVAAAVVDGVLVPGVRPGDRADVAVLDDALGVTRTVLAGEEVA